MTIHYFPKILGAEASITSFQAHCVAKLELEGRFLLVVRIENVLAILRGIRIEK